MTDALQIVTFFGTPAVGRRALATDVLDASCRRRFAGAADALTRASAEAPTNALFEILLDQGRAMRRESTRRVSLAAGPSGGGGEQE